jgi:beta-glucosidase
MKQELSFPQGFLWGASTASHQVEGNTTNDWSEWEKKNATRLAQESAWHFSRLPNWKTFEKDATDPKNYISGDACDHYHRFEEDFDIVQSLGHNAHRFSIEWSRIEPQEGVFDTDEIQHYRKVLQALRTRNITVFVTLWHWTLPLWLVKKGGLENNRFPEYFARYTEKIVQELGKEVTFWITINEPDVLASHSYLKGVWPPQKKNPFSYIHVLFNLINAHRKSFAAIKYFFPDAQVGIAKHQVVFETARPTYFNRALQKAGHYLWNQWFLNRIQSTQDFIGLNHYNRNVIENGFYKNPNERVTDFGWEFYPESLYQAIIDLKPYNKPLYITENGLADASDTLRQEFIPKALASVHKAITDGADVRGYFHWSLLDNFEWDKGFWLRFGLVEINYTTQKRTIRPSALAYAEVCKNNTLLQDKK